MIKIEYLKGKFIELEGQVIKESHRMFIELNGKMIKGSHGVKELPTFELLILEKMLNTGNGKVVKLEAFATEVWKEENFRSDDMEGFKKNKFNNRWSVLNNLVEKIAPGTKDIFLKRDSLGCSCNYVSLEGIEDASVNRIEEYETLCQQIADYYYGKYHELEFKKQTDKINQNLMEVFCFPSFEDGKFLDLSESRNSFICAPNGFGKSALLKTILLATNPSSKINERQELAEKITELKDYYKIQKNYLTLFIDLKNVNSNNEFCKSNDLCKWLLFASDLEKIMKLDEFRELVAYYNKMDCLVLIFDSLDEVVQKREDDISRDGVLTKIRLLTCADEICNKAKVFIASRPLVLNEDDMPNRDFQYLYMETLFSQQKSVEMLIEKYSPEYKDDLVRYIYGDPYLKYLVVTPQLLTEIMSNVLLKWYNKEKGIQGIRKDEAMYGLISNIIRDMMTRFKNKDNVASSAINYEHIYETFAYVSLFNNVENKRADFAKFQELILENVLRYEGKHRKSIEPKDIIDTYEHYCLFNTKGQYLELLAPEVLTPYYLARYMFKFCRLSLKEEMYDREKIWSEFESVLERKNEYLYDMLVFLFGIIHDGIDGERICNQKGLEYNIWRKCRVFNKGKSRRYRA